MPSGKQSYADGVLYYNMQGQINEQDARRFAKSCKDHAYEETYPIIAVVDLTNATYVTAIARYILSGLADQPFLYSIAVIVDDFVVEQNIRLTLAMSAGKHIEIYSSQDAARNYAIQHAALLKEIHNEPLRFR